MNYYKNIINDCFAIADHTDLDEFKEFYWGRISLDNLVFDGKNFLKLKKVENCFKQQT